MKIRFYEMKLLFATLILFAALCSACIPPQSKTSQARIEKEHRKKEKQAEKQHKEAIKMHEKNQSKGTRAMMKKSKKESRKNTPMKPPGGKKCK